MRLMSHEKPGVKAWFFAVYSSVMKGVNMLCMVQELLKNVEMKLYIDELLNVASSKKKVNVTSKLKRKVKENENRISKQN